MAVPIRALFKNLTGKIGDVVSEVVVDRDKKNELMAAITQTAMQFESDHESQLTERHKSDMISDSWLSKNIRPLALIYLTVNLTILSYTDGNIGEFSVNPAYIDLYQILLVSAYSFYFAMRGWEKIQKIRSQSA